MVIIKHRHGFWGLALAVVLVPSGVAFAAGSLSNSLTGFTGSSDLAATQTALAGIGLEFASNEGLAEDFSSDPSIVFDSNGATFGSLFAGDGGRNYMRTVDSYAFDSYRAEVTVSLLGAGLGDQVIFFGMGSGNITNWGTPDFAGVPTVFMTPEGFHLDEMMMPVDGALNTNAVDGLAGDWYSPMPPCPLNNWCKVVNNDLVEGQQGTHRLRMDFDATTKQWQGSIDIDYAGGPFVADVSSPVYDLTISFDDGVFIANGWPTNPSKIYFGGDDSAIFKDFSVVVGAAPVEDADFDDDGDVDGRDFLIWQRGFGIGTTNGTGDANNSGTVDGDDLVIWQGQYGGGSLAAVSVPEPSSVLLCALSSLLVICRFRRLA